jgi:lipopolysaccharide export system protein LptA
VYGNPLKEMYKPRPYKTYFFIFFLLFGFTLNAQKGGGKSISIKQAGSLSYDETRNNARVLKGNVICEHEGTLLYCDTAYIYEKENRMVAMGHILITQGDSIRVTAERLIYDGRSRMATLQNNVKCVERDMVLTTPVMLFNIERSIASYYNGGTIVNQKNTLVSKHGHYFSSTKEACFNYDVSLTNPDYTMSSDTLKYKVSNKTVYFLGPSMIKGKNDYIYCENGWYDTVKELSRFSKNAVLVTSQQQLRGDSLVYNRLTKTGSAYKNVTMIDTAQKSIIFGNEAVYREKSHEIWITGKAIYARIMDKDTLFLAAEKLYHKDIDSVDNLVLAYHRVRVLHKQIQAKADSASFNSKDSLLHFYYSPVLWTKFSQASAKHMNATLGKGSVKGFRLDGQALLIQQVDSLRTDKYNQLSGKTITGILSADTIRKLSVSGNVEVLYFPKNNNKYVGLNSTSCKEAVLWFKNNEVERVALTPKTSGALKPLKEIDVPNARLKGFNWQYNSRPKTKYDLHP